MRPNAAMVSLIRFCGRLFELVVLNNRSTELAKVYIILYNLGKYFDELVLIRRIGDERR